METDHKVLSALSQNKSIEINNVESISNISKISVNPYEVLKAVNG